MKHMIHLEKRYQNNLESMKGNDNKKYNKCFKYSVTVALDHEEVGKNPEKITKINSYIQKLILIYILMGGNKFSIKNKAYWKKI